MYIKNAIDIEDKGRYSNVLRLYTFIKMIGRRKLIPQKYLKMRIGALGGVFIK
jgi:hypothetical protein